MKRVMGNLGSMRCTLETNLLGENVLFLDLFGNSSNVAAMTPAGAVAFTRKLREMADKIDKYAHAVGTVEPGYEHLRRN